MELATNAIFTQFDIVGSSLLTPSLIICDFVWRQLAELKYYLSPLTALDYWLNATNTLCLGPHLTRENP